MDQIYESLISEMACRNENESKACEMLIDITNAKANFDEFWNEESNVIFNDIWEEAENILEELNIESDDYLCFCLFQIVLLNFAYFAHEHEGFRRFIQPNKK